MRPRYIFLSIALIVASCKKYSCPETIYCGVDHDFALVGFDASEIDTVIAIQ